MRRSLFFFFLLRVALLLAIVMALLVLVPAPMKVWAVLAAVLLSAIVAQSTVSSLRRSLDPIQRSAVDILNPPIDPPASAARFRDFDELAQALTDTSRQVQQALNASRNSRNDLEALLDSMQDAVVAVDSSGRILWSNHRMQRLMPSVSLGHSASSPVRIGHAVVQTLRDPDFLQAIHTALEQRVTSQKRTSGVLPGSLFEVNASPMPGGGAVAVLHDITRVEHVERTQRDFVANVSHELRTPLTSITGYVETLLDHEQSLSPTARSFLETILKNATRMNRLTEDLLVMARVESTEQTLNPAPQRPDVLVRDAVQSLSGLIQENEALLEIGELTTRPVHADHDAILQVLGNLIENAIKYGQTKTMSHSRVIVSAREIAVPYAAVEFSVRDFGQGIPFEHLPRIFERFYRVDKARSRESGGTGLGLSIAKHMIQTQGGTIWAESELNAGSTFLFTLPLAE